ncbi:polysaccharide pyruvyl transferase family protein [Caulobacter sp. LjRoot300]|uniref:polysaccharide pyruvyl transferase family protein n=1 Tax=Caulobacter sp. LjRoot300 TaxID=3342321 RepID=UPI003ED0545D
MTTLFCVRPTTPNIGNDLINKATRDLLYEVFGPDVSVVNVSALGAGGRGGLTASQIYDMNQFADGVVIGGGNLFENGQLTVDTNALRALRAPMMMIGVSHGRIYEASGAWVHRTDSMPDTTIRQLVAKAEVAMVRDHGSRALLHEAGAGNVELAGCPSLFLPANASAFEPARQDDRRVLLSIRHPTRMSVPPALQWRTPHDLRRLIDALRGEYGDHVHLVCHDYMDLDFAAGYPDVPHLYFDDVERYIDALRSCRLNVSYRLHAFLPCVAFGVHSIHLSYDERGKAMVATAGLGEWDIDLMTETDMVATVLARARDIETYHRLRVASAAETRRMREVTVEGLRRFAQTVERRRADASRC